MKADLLIENGRVIDPAEGIDEITTIAVKNGKIICADEVTETRQRIDAKGLIVIPGMIDHHTHFHHRATDIGVPPDVAMLSGGVTTAADAGSAGVSTIKTFLDHCMNYTVKTRFYVHVSPLGMATRQYQEILKPEMWEADQFRNIFDYGAGRVLGLKMKIGKNLLGAQGLKPFEEALRMAKELNTNIVIHPTDPPVPQAEVLCRLRPGDTFAHVYNSRGETLLKNNRIIPEAWEAKKRGILFDVAHGGMNFSFHIAEHAISDGFLPDFISSDLTTVTWNQTPVYNLLNVMSKFLLLGLDLKTIIACVTANPARHIGMAGRIGTLKPGAYADIAIIRECEGNYLFTDADGDTRWGDRLLVPYLTIADGMIVYRKPEFSCI